MVSVASASRYITSASRYITPASRYQPHYQSKSSMYTCGRIPRNFAELVEAVPIGSFCWTSTHYYLLHFRTGSFKQDVSDDKSYYWSVLESFYRLLLFHFTVVPFKQDDSDDSSGYWSVFGSFYKLLLLYLRISPFKQYYNIHKSCYWQGLE